MIKAEVVGDSINDEGNRITSMVVTFPRIILAEFNTHRMFSRNSASSRAIPFDKMVKAIRENPFIPMAWQQDHKGMQGKNYIDDETVNRILIPKWKEQAKEATWRAEQFSKDYLVTKQIVNRLLEPYMWHTVMVTATEWENFFALRCPKYRVSYTVTARSRKHHTYLCDNSMDLLEDDPIHNSPSLHDDIEWLKINEGQAEIHMMALAEAMWDAMNESIPVKLKTGEWHIPFNKKITELLIDKEGVLYPSDQYEHETQGTANDVYTTDLKIKMATVMAARTSYTLVGEDQKPMTVERMISLHDELLKANPKHMSPFEHCALIMPEDMIDERDNQRCWSGNFRGFIQYRKTIPGENITK